jgi:uncharacterized protein (DUF952 family)
MLSTAYEELGRVYKRLYNQISRQWRNNMTARGSSRFIYKICPEPLWRAAESAGVFRGSPVDLQDGFIHFSTAEQAVETAAKHFAGQDNLLLVQVECARLGDRLKWEPSRGGALFPHLYGDLELAAVAKVEKLPLGPDGRHMFPPLA